MDLAVLLSLGLNSHSAGADIVLMLEGRKERSREIPIVSAHSK